MSLSVDLISKKDFKKKTTVMVASPYFYPGYKAGGALRTIVNIVEQLSDCINLKIITRDRDAFMNDPYPDIEIEQWQSVLGARVYYVDSRKLTLAGWKRLLNQHNYDILYLNSFFSSRFTIIPLLLARTRQLKNSNVILAPRGELAKSALSIKSVKKSTYLQISKIVGLFNQIQFQGSSKYEKNDIQQAIGLSANVHVVEDLPAVPQAKVEFTKKKNPGQLNLIFLSRIAPVKNLNGALEILKKLKHKCLLQIFGPIDDRHHWERCQSLIHEMPSHVRVEYYGEIKNTDISDAFETNHFLLLPTQGENFGHVIFEALSHGIPIIISDQTIWRNLREKGIGWDLDLTDTATWVDVMEECYQMGQCEYDTISMRCNRFATKYLQNSNLPQGYRDLFSQARQTSLGDNGKPNEL